MGRLFLVLIIGTILFFIVRYGLSDYLSLEYIRGNLDSLKGAHSDAPILASILYFGVYVLTASFALPAAAALTLLGGAVFDPITAFLLTSFASTLGATLCFWASRYLLRDRTRKMFGPKLKTIDHGIRTQGAAYLLGLRLIPLFPFFLVNAAMGLTPIATATFWWASQIGMIPGTILYVNAGVQLSQIHSPKDVLSPAVVASLVLLGLFAPVTKRILEKLKAGRLYRRFKRPLAYDYNMVVIGGGAAGLVTAYIASLVKAKVALIERDKMGGDCLNTGCVPSKALIKSASILAAAKNSHHYGIKSMAVDFDFAEVMERTQRVVRTIAPHDSRERYTSLGVDCLSATATILSPWEVDVGGQKITTRSIVIATGGRPFVPPIPGIENADILTSDTLWNLRQLPPRLIVLGGGAIGLEMAQCFARFGSRVTLVEAGGRIAPRQDEDASGVLADKLRREGVVVLTGHRAKEFRQNVLVCESGSEDVELPFDKVLVAVGRRADTEELCSDDMDIKLRSDGAIEADEYLRTNYPNIFVCGDATGPFQLTHAASHQAWYAALNGLFGGWKKWRVDYSVIPQVIYTDPEIASVGLDEESARSGGIAYEVYRYDLGGLDRAVADGETEGFVKVLVDPGTDRLLGACTVGSRAGETIMEFVSAMKHGYGLGKILGTIHPYPTMGEANKFVAGIYKGAHKPEGLLRWAEKYHRFLRR